MESDSVRAPTLDTELMSYKQTATLRLKVANAWLADDIAGTRAALGFTASLGESPLKLQLPMTSLSGALQGCIEALDPRVLESCLQKFLMNLGTLS